MLFRSIKKKTQEKEIYGQITENTKPYRVDGEIGRFEFTTHRIVNKADVLFNTGNDLFFTLGPKKLYKTVG